MTKQYTTIDVMRRMNVSRSTIFRWESERIISPPQRDWRGWRVYTDRHLEEIRQHQEAGLMQHS